MQRQSSGQNTGLYRQGGDLQTDPSVQIWPWEKPSEPNETREEQLVSLLITVLATIHHIDWMKHLKGSTHHKFCTFYAFPITYRTPVGQTSIVPKFHQQTTALPLSGCWLVSRKKQSSSATTSLHWPDCLKLHQNTRPLQLMFINVNEDPHPHSNASRKQTVWLQLLEVTQTDSETKLC
jgi:hypothetical protein